MARTGSAVPRWSVRLVAIALGLGACATSSERGWQRPNTAPAVVQRDEAECMTAAGIERAPRTLPGTAAIPSRDADVGARGYAEYVDCMTAKGYARPER